MPDLNLMLPSTPDGVDASTHLRSLLATSSEVASEIVDRLHEEVRDDLRDVAAEASTLLRELRHGISHAVENENDTGRLTLLYAAIQTAIDQGDDVLMRSELRDALRGDGSTLRACEQHALCLGELAAEGYTSFLCNQVHDYELFAHVREHADVPLMHALVRAICGGFVAGRRQPLNVRDGDYRIDNLLLKALEMSERVAPDDPLADLRMAAITRIALWNLTRISLRDDHGEGRRAQYENRRRTALRSIKADTRWQLEQLGVVPDYEHAYDIGVALAMVEPILARRAEMHDVVVPRRANAVAWLELFGTPA